ncbi:MAG TPA: hypothetical protein VFS43_04325 [Polyangiaceae bacterium]|nr:hypothetical protein [Polyangiaceae bacterium]
MRTTARRFRPIFHRPASLPSRPSLPARPPLSSRPALPPPTSPDPEPVALEIDPAAPSLRLKAWLRLGAHAVLAAAWVTLPQLVGGRIHRDREPLVVEVDRPCPCGRAAHASGPSLRESLAPNDDAALDEPEAPAAPRPRPPSAAGFCEPPRAP